MRCASFAGEALFFRERGQAQLPVWERPTRAGADGLPGFHRPGHPSERAEAFLLDSEVFTALRLTSA